MTRQFPRMLAAALFLSGAAACSDTGTDSQVGTTDLSTREVRSLAFGVSALGTNHVEDAAWSIGGASFSISGSDGASLDSGPGGGHGGPGGPGVGGLGIWGPNRPGVQGTTTTTIDRTAPCPQGGTTHTVTKITSVVDTVARTGKVTTESTDTPSQCGFTVDSVNATLRTIANPGTVIRITGAPSLTTQSSSSYTWEAASSSAPRGRLTRGVSTSTQTGSFTYTTSDNRSGTCSVNLTTTFDPATRTQKVTGTFCGQTINVTSTLPDHGGHHR